MSDLNGRTALITGGARGIGLAIATRLKADGAAVVLVDVDKDALTEASETLGGVRTFAGDVQDVETLGEWLKDEGVLVDILVNNAAIAPRVTSLELTPAILGEVMAVNFESPVHLACLVANRLIEAGRTGTIVNVSSVNAYRGIPEMLPYNASKAAMVSATTTLAVEWADHGIRVNAVLPGSTRTRIWEEGGFSDEERAAFAARNPLRRLAEPSEIAAAVAFLASDESSFVTGHALVADGGLTAII
jgi:NAD(P)-dependent dehydrogenase (short-subunit alcohol dehydrogenase family)